MARPLAMPDRSREPSGRADPTSPWRRRMPRMTGWRRRRPPAGRPHPTFRAWLGQVLAVAAAREDAAQFEALQQHQQDGYGQQDKEGGQHGEAPSPRVPWPNGWLPRRLPWPVIAAAGRGVGLSPSAPRAGSASGPTAPPACKVSTAARIRSAPDAGRGRPQHAPKPAGPASRVSGAGPPARLPRRRSCPPAPPGAARATPPLASTLADRSPMTAERRRPCSGRRLFCIRVILLGGPAATDSPAA